MKVERGKVNELAPEKGDRDGSAGHRRTTEHTLVTEVW